MRVSIEREDAEAVWAVAAQVPGQDPTARRHGDRFRAALDAAPWPDHGPRCQEEDEDNPSRCAPDCPQQSWSPPPTQPEQQTTGPEHRA